MFGLPAVTVVTASAAFVFGMTLALLGSLKLALAKRLSLGEGRIGLLLSLLNVALMPMMIVSGLLLDGPLGARWVILLGSLLTATALFVLGLRPRFSTAVAAVLLAGLGGAGLCTGSIVLMRTAFYPTAPIASLNLGIAFFALGALITPVLVDVLSSLWAFRWVSLILATLCLFPALAALMTRGDAFPAPPHHAETAGLASAQAVWLAGLALFFYAPLEASISIWATTFLTELGQSERGATWTLSGFWCAFLGSRLLTALLAQTPLLEDREPWLLVILPALVAVLLGNLSGTVNRASARRGLYVVGFLLGPIFPTLVAFLFRQLHIDQLQDYGTAYGLVFAFGSLGSLVLAPVSGLIARRRNVQFALRMPMLLAILFTLAAVVFSVLSRRD
jgi:fucose permease